MVPGKAHSFSHEPGLEIWSVWGKGAMLKWFKEVETIPLPWYKQKGGTKICFQFGTWGLDLESQIECYKGPPDCTSHYQKPESVLLGWNHGNHIWLQDTHRSQRKVFTIETGFFVRGGDWLPIFYSPGWPLCLRAILEPADNLTRTWWTEL